MKSECSKILPGMNRNKLLLVFLSVLFVFASCSKYNKLLKSNDIDLKYTKAIEYYEAEDYYKAYPLLEELSAIMRGTARAEKVNFYYAYCEYYTGDYMLAAYRFKNFAKTFPNSSYAEECIFMSSFCHYIISPVYSLDQTDTKQAISEMQVFINRYPKSERIDTCNVLIQTLRDKLETKAFMIAKQYYKMENYKSAIISFNNILIDFPDSKYREEAMFLALKASYLLAINSVETKKEARLKDTIESYVKFADSFSKSSLMKEAEFLYENALKEKQKLLTPKS
jgi:outer membrane protein assembly factor BamD